MQCLGYSPGLVCVCSNAEAIIQCVYRTTLVSQLIFLPVHKHSKTHMHTQNRLPFFGTEIPSLSSQPSPQLLTSDTHHTIKPRQGDNNGRVFFLCSASVSWGAEQRTGSIHHPTRDLSTLHWPLAPCVCLFTRTQMFSSCTFGGSSTCDGFGIMFSDVQKCHLSDLLICCCRLLLTYGRRSISYKHSKTLWNRPCF